jgi:hypothetical protein
MRSLLLLATLAIALGAHAEERRIDDAIYRSDEPATPAAAIAPVQAEAADPAEAARQAAAADEALSALRAGHAAAYAALEAEALAATSPAERDAIEARAAGLKADQHREELEWLLARAEARGELRYADELRAALAAERAPRPEPVRVQIERDPSTGRVIAGSSEESTR